MNTSTPKVGTRPASNSSLWARDPLTNAEIVWCDRAGEWIIFIKTNETDSAEKAVDMLLQSTRDVLTECYEDNVVKGEEAERRDIDWLDYYYQQFRPDHSIELGPIWRHN
ncbi:hypothetical protein Tdes44962_MAKER01566 [Teratosphaeria destructans]|uniref:Uncharacterized protein n=1 Tax=Teratosphaeria destructans TaxID=418781 RepID=A0A9W7SYV8_9PEZI|nr:hypothetical protein Tdes44962_MAKER01566 [Teratosphaeria destructans]